MEYKKFYISGTVINENTKAPLYNYRVEAWDKDQKYDDFVGVCQTDKHGKFEILFDESYFREQYPETNPDIYFRVFRAKKLIKTTKDDVIWDAKERISVTIPIKPMVVERKGKDFLQPKQAYNLMDFYVKSDFKGVYKQTKKKTSKNASFIKDMFGNSFSDMKFNPLKVHSTPVEQVVGTDVNTATNNLQANEIEVEQVLEYKPGLNNDSIKKISAKPFDLKKGEKVNLYQENGKVKYYTIVKSPRNTEEMAIKVEQQQKEIAALKKTVDASQKSVIEKDRQISELTRNLEKMQQDQMQIIATLKQTPSINTDNLKNITDIKDIGTTNKPKDGGVGPIK